MKISACVVAKNEEENLRVCLDCIKDIVDEMIVVDTGSTDQTIAVAKKYGAQVYRYEWQDDFALAKNFALDKAGGDWIIFLDADEYFTAETVENVLDVIEKHQHECDGFLTQMVNIDVDQENKIMDQFFTVRIFRNDLNMRFVGKVHEQIHNLTGRKNAWYKVNADEIQLYHTGYSGHIIRQKCERNLNLLLAQLQGNEEDINLYRYLADTYYGLDAYEQAIKYARLDLTTGKKELAYASRSYRILVNALGRIQADFKEIEAAIQQAITTFPELPDFYAEYALLFFKYGDYDRALELMQEAIRLNETYDAIETSLFQNNFKLTNSLLGLIYEKKNAVSNSIESYEQVLREARYETGIFIALFKLIFREEPVYVIAFLNQIYDKTKIEDLDFLIRNISTVTKGKILAYYLQAKQKLQKTKNVDLLELECAKRYTAIQNIVTEELTGKINFMSCAAILQNNFKQVTTDIDFLPDTHRNVVLRFYGKKDSLTAKNFDAYQEILLEIMRAAEDEILNKYCACAKDFELIHILAIAKILNRNLCFLQAVSLYEFALTYDITEGIVPILYDTAYCYYKLGYYEFAIKYFEKALTFGYKKDNEMTSFMMWSEENLMIRESEVKG
ncbi:tetratricopeptide repeat-containing glycosyltransferase family 2 protein [Anaerosinus massiliensis]|uniref:tetratricopeptide repeat-containing glycosyltransferase family 2 protein n=1 Tax=Massilibacillus massiliensis TaxID=1806837 RepID=UPI000DA5F1D2|nr:glycosyltransferase family 2 protein [Massilibacillus massiliensis]